MEGCYTISNCQDHGCCEQHVGPGKDDVQIHGFDIVSGTKGRHASEVNTIEINAANLATVEEAKGEWPELTKALKFAATGLAITPSSEKNTKQKLRTEEPVDAKEQKQIVPALHEDSAIKAPEKRKIREVHVQLSIRRVFNLDTVNQSFAVQLLVIMTWLLPDGEDPFNEDGKEWRPTWVPKYRIKSVLEEMADKEECFSVEEHDGMQYVRLEAQHRVSIYERLELEAFPHDCQDLTIEIESTFTTSQVLWLPPLEGTCIQLAKERCYLSDFELIDERPFTWGIGTANANKKVVPHLSVTLHVVRNSFFYILNVAAVTFVLSTLILTTWTMSPSNLQGRLEIDFLLVLTAITFKLSLLDMVPKVSYMTPLDTYVLCAFIFLVIATLCHAVIPHLHADKEDISDLTLEPLYFAKEGDLNRFDTICFRVYVSLWFIFNLLWGFLYFWTGKREYGKFVMLIQQKQEAFNEELKQLLSQISETTASQGVRPPPQRKDEGARSPQIDGHEHVASLPAHKMIL